MRPTLLLLFLFTASGCHHTRATTAAPAPAQVRFAVEELHSECDLKTLARSTAEAGAVDCGEVEASEETSQRVLACIREAEGKPFVAVLHYQGIDSGLTQALQGTATGELWQLWYDSDPYGSGNPRNAEISRRRCERIEPRKNDPSFLECTGKARGRSVCRATTHRLGPVEAATRLMCHADGYGRYFRVKVAQGVTSDGDFQPVPPGMLLACKSARSADDFECSATEEVDDELGFPLDGWRNP